MQQVGLKPLVTRKLGHRLRSHTVQPREVLCACVCVCVCGGMDIVKERSKLEKCRLRGEGPEKTMKECSSDDVITKGVGGEGRRW